MSPEQARIAQSARSRAYYQSHREEVLERQRQKRLDPVVGEELRARERARIASLSPEERERRAQMNREWYRRNPRSSDENARQHLRFRYGLTPSDRKWMLDEQNGCCYLCGEPLDLTEPRKIHVDHDHTCCRGNRSCGTCIRGIACDPCNRGIGYFAEDPERMRRVADNLEMASRRLRTPVPYGTESAAVTPGTGSRQ